MKVLRAHFVHWTKPFTSSLPLGTLADLARSKAELLAENALLRQQLDHPQAAGETPSMHEERSHPPRTLSTGGSVMEANALSRFNEKPSCVGIGSSSAVYWKRRSKASSHKPRVAAETIALIREMAKENWLWGAERIRGELLKLGMHVCKRTIQKYMRNVRSSQPRGQKWATFVHNHSAQIWACDFLQVTDLCFSTTLCVLHH